MSMIFSKPVQKLLAVSLLLILTAFSVADAKCTVLDEIKCHLKAQDNIEYIPQKVIPVKGSKKGRYQLWYNDTIMQEMVDLFKKLPKEEYPAYLAWVEENLYDLPSPYLYNAVFVAYLLGEEQTAKELLYWYGRIQFYDGERCKGERFKAKSSDSDDPYSWYHSRAKQASGHMKGLIKGAYKDKVSSRELYKLDTNLFPDAFFHKTLQAMKALTETPPKHNPIWACSYPPLTKKDWLVIKKAPQPVAIKNWISPQNEWGRDIEHCYESLVWILKFNKKLPPNWKTEESAQ